jgi:hypothetical protein
MTFTNPANSWIAGHLSDPLTPKRNQNGGHPKPRCGVGGLNAGMPTTDHNHLISFNAPHSQLKATYNYLILLGFVDFLNQCVARFIY